MKKLLIIGGSGLFGRSIIDCGINKKLVRHKINEIFVISRKRISSPNGKMPLSKIDEIKPLSAMCQLNTLCVKSNQDVRHRG